MTETWREVPGWPRYEVSDMGAVRSIRTGHLLSLAPMGAGYPTVHLFRSDGFHSTHCVHILVLTAFVGPRPEGSYGRHLNDDKLDNRLANLAYGTPSQNAFDAVTNGRNQNAIKTHCINGHAFDAANTIYRDPARRRRDCRTCRRDRNRRYEARQRAAA